MRRKMHVLHRKADQMKMETLPAAGSVIPCRRWECICVDWGV